MYRWLFEKRLKRKPPAWFLYIAPVMGVWLCHMNLTSRRDGNVAANIAALAILSIIMLVGIALNLRRFAITLQKPYQSRNLHVALASVFAVVILFAAVYSVIYI